MFNSRSERYKAIGRHLIEQAEHELTANGDLLQASEKTWGAVALAVKAVAQDRNWNHSSHDQIRDAAIILSHEFELPRLRERFNAANELHRNFYEHLLGYDDLLDGIRIARLIIEDLEWVHAQELRPFVPQSRQQESRMSNLSRPNPRHLPNDISAERLPPIEAEPPDEHDMNSPRGGV